VADQVNNLLLMVVDGGGNYTGARRPSGAAPTELIHVDNPFQLDGAIDMNSTLDVAGQVDLGASGGAADTTVRGGLTVDENLHVNGNITHTGSNVTLGGTTVTYEDSLFLFAKDQAGAAALDVGFIGERGDDTNIGFLWDESADEFVCVETSSNGSAATATITDYAPLHVGGFTADDASTFTGAATFTAAADFDGGFTVAAGQSLTGDGALEIGVAAGAFDLSIKMGDAAGAQKVSFIDSGDAEVASIDSDGGITGVTLSITSTSSLTGDVTLGGVLKGTDDGTGVILGHAPSGAGTGSAAQLVGVSTAQRDNLTGVNGMLVYNSTTGQFEGYDGSWQPLGSGGAVPGTDSETFTINQDAADTDTDDAALLLLAGRGAGGATTQAWRALFDYDTTGGAGSYQGDLLFQYAADDGGAYTEVFRLNADDNSANFAGQLNADLGLAVSGGNITHTGANNLTISSTGTHQFTGGDLDVDEAADFSANLVISAGLLRLNNDLNLTFGDDADATMDWNSAGAYLTIDTANGANQDAGGSIQSTLGAGGAGSGPTPGGSGGSYTWNAGTGGAADATGGTAVSGSGGAWTVNLGTGGAGASGDNDHAGGIGGAANLTGGTGGAGSSDAAPGSGGDILFTAGAPGADGGFGIGAAVSGTFGAVGGMGMTGTPASNNAGTIGGAATITGGMGGSGDGTGAGGAGAVASLTGGAGASGGATGANGVGGAASTVGGAGGSSFGGGVGGVGGAANLTGGAGGQGDATNAGGVGGAVAIDAGAGGADGGGGGAGAAGAITIGGTNATQVDIGKSGSDTAIKGTLTVDEDLDLDGDVVLAAAKEIQVEGYVGHTTDAPANGDIFFNTVEGANHRVKKCDGTAGSGSLAATRIGGVWRTGDKAVLPGNRVAVINLEDNTSCAIGDRLFASVNAKGRVVAEDDGVPQTGFLVMVGIARTAADGLSADQTVAADLIWTEPTAL